MARRKELHEEDGDDTRPPWRRALSRTFTRQKSHSGLPTEVDEKSALEPGKIRRRGTEPKRIDPNGEIVEEPVSMGDGLNAESNTRWGTRVHQYHDA